VANKFKTVFCLIVLFCTPAYAQQQKPDAKLVDTWLKMTDDSVTLYQQHKHKEAIALAEETLGFAKVNFGSEHPNVAESMDNLATYLVAEGRYAEAEVLYKKALAIIEKNFGPESDYAVIFLSYLSDFYKKIGKTEEANILREKASSIRHKNK